MRSQLVEEDYTRKAWRADVTSNDNLEDCGKLIIDRIVSSYLFQRPKIQNHPDLFVPGTNHIWVNGTTSIHNWVKQDVDNDVMRKWVGRRVKLPKKKDKSSLIHAFQTTVDAALHQKGITAQEITTNHQFDQIYNEMSNAIVTESQKTFGN